MPSAHRPKLAVVLKGYPRLSETFVAQELLGLERAGFDLSLVSLRHPTDKRRHPVHDEIRAPVLYLPEYLYEEPLRVLRGVLRSVRQPGFGRAVRRFLRDLRRDPSPNRVRRFGQAAVLVAEMPEGAGWLYAHFIHTPASVAAYAAAITGLPWSCSAHAKDIWTTADWDLSEKLSEMRWAVTCTATGQARLAALSAGASPVHLVYHGLDLDRFPPPPVGSANEAEAAGRNGASADNPVRILSVGRAVPKKGYDDLLDALKRLPGGLFWHFTHVGGGDVAALKEQAERLGISSRVTFLGALDQPAVLALLRNSDIFALASRVTEDGDRDGLPNVLVEAASQRLACVATEVSEIPELLTDGETGLLVLPRNPDRLADALARLIGDPDLRRRLGGAAERRVRADFDHRAGLARLARLFDANEGGPR